MKYGVLSALGKKDKRYFKREISGKPVTWTKVTIQYLPLSKKMKAKAAN